MTAAYQGPGPDHPPRILPCLPALGYATAQGGGRIVAAAGGTASFRLGVQNVTDRPLTVRWSAAVPPGLRLDAPRGSLAVGRQQATSSRLTVRVLPSARTGTYRILFRLQAAPAAPLPPVVVAVTVR